MKCLRVYLEELSFACGEAAASDDPRHVILLCVLLILRAPLSIWELAVHERPRIAA
jgi:hypothetical protein